MRVTEKTNKKKNILGNMFFYFLKYTCIFSECFFYLPKIPVFFLYWQQSNARAGQKKTHIFFFGNALSKSNERSSKTEKKKHSG